jgi:hypothetical protein
VSRIMRVYACQVSKTSARDMSPKEPVVEFHLLKEWLPDWGVMVLQRGRVSRVQ